MNQVHLLASSKQGQIKVYSFLIFFQTQIYIIINSLLEKPKFDRTGVYGSVKEIRVKAGEPITFELPIDGAPTPEVSLTKNGDKLPTSDSNGYDL